MNAHQVSILLQGAGVVMILWACFNIGKSVWIRFYSNWITAKASGASLKFAQEMFITVALLVGGTACLVAAFS